jgi:predicted peptidase
MKNFPLFAIGESTGILYGLILKKRWPDVFPDELPLCGLYTSCVYL